MSVICFLCLYILCPLWTTSLKHLLIFPIVLVCVLHWLYCRFSKSKIRTNRKAMMIKKCRKEKPTRKPVFIIVRIDYTNDSFIGFFPMCSLCHHVKLYTSCNKQTEFKMHILLFHISTWYIQFFKWVNSYWHLIKNFLYLTSD